jgi:malate synthase
VAKQIFDGVLGTRAHQVERTRDDVTVTAAELLDVRIPGAQVSEAGLRNAASVALQYLESWLRGVGAVGIFNLMEDAATAEISRSQIWQWVRHSTRLVEGPVVTPELVRVIADEELAKIREAVGAEVFARGRYAEARVLLDEIALHESFPEFLTLPAYDRID